MMSFEEKYAKAIALIQQHPREDADKNKPLIPHLMRVGTYLDRSGYSDLIVQAGLLHDLLEWTDNPQGVLLETFGEHVYRIVLANTKNRAIENPSERRKDSVDRCAAVGKDALIVKADDVLDSYQYYTQTQNDREIERSKEIAKLVLEQMSPADDPIFGELARVVV